jgi:endonuclease/exonuclease/phosphatase family metal-dependent hydrolase
LRTIRTALIYAGGVVALAACSGCLFVANRFYVPPALEQADFNRPATPLRVAGSTISLASWNVGYAGMGKDSDFIMDLGEQRRPLSADLVVANAAAIARTLASLDTDLILLQEAARPSWNTYGHDVIGDIAAALPGYGLSFGADIDTRFVPKPFSIEIGNASFSRRAVLAAERRGLPLEPDFEFGLFRKGYRMHILRLDGPDQWVIVNIHLSAFDDKDDAVRERQLAAVMQFAQAEYQAGHRVIIGGDWNMRLAPTDFLHTTEDRFLFWVRDLPPDAIPQGWRLALDKARPTVRTANKPYVAGENYTLIIDGFLVSPNVEIMSVETRDLGFVHSDHNPAVLHARAR